MTLHTPEVPDLTVIDEAIQSILQKRNIWSCMALKRAHTKVHKVNLLWTFESEYVLQYDRFMRKCNDGDYPIWWNAHGPYSQDRVAALRAFRQACVDRATHRKDV